MKLEFSGSPEITAARERVWERLMDPHFLAQSAPGVESVEVIDPTHFKVTSGFGAGSIKVRFTMDVELFDIVPGRSAKVRMKAQAPGSAVDILSGIEIREAGPNRVRLNGYSRRPGYSAHGGRCAQADRAVLGGLCPARYFRMSDGEGILSPVPGARGSVPGGRCP